MSKNSKLAMIQESVIREMTRKAIKEDAINLSQGMPDFNPPEEIIKTLEEAIKKQEHQYTITYGNLDLRKRIAEKFKSYNEIDADPENEITVTCGASEAIASSILALCSSDDEIIIFEPWYENYYPAAVIAGAKTKFVPLNPENFALDEEKLKAALTDKTKAVIVNTPHNPTGHVFSQAELNTIADICIDYNLLAITDEIYEYIIYDGNKHISLGSLPDMAERTITVSGFSKTYSMTGWRVGYVAAAKHLMAEIRKVHDYLTVCAPSLQQTALLAAFQLGAEYYQQLRERYQLNRDYVVETLRSIGFNIVPPQGAYYVFANITEFGFTDKELADKLVENRGVAVVPGSSFYNNKEVGENFVRFSFAQKLETLKIAMERIGERLR